MGGFVGGIIAGAVVVLALGAVLSLNTPLSSKPAVTTHAPEPAPLEDSVSTADAPDAGTDADLVELPPEAPEPVDEQSDSLAGVTNVDPTPDTQPVVGESEPAIETPDVAPEPEVAVAPDAPVAPPAPAIPGGTPQVESLPEVADTAPEPPAPPAEEVAVLEPEAEPAPLPGTPEEPKVENPFENSPIAVEGDEDTLPRNLPRIATLPQIGGDQPATAGSTIGRRVVPLTERDDPVVEAEETEQVPVGKPIEAYAASFENPESKPLMSIILIDDEGAFGAEALRDFPYPLSFAISPSDPDAAEKMARHREAGFEVMAIADLPEAANAQDAEVSLAVWFETLPETVGILEGVNTGIQGNRQVADQVAAIAAGTGRGLITQDNGLNTVQKLAARNGTPSGVVFRDIDGARQDPKIMRRFLDQAAFRAGQQGTVVMLGRLRPETISALLLWGLEDRGNRVAMAPISAVMLKEVQ